MRVVRLHKDKHGHVPAQRENRDVRGPAGAGAVTGVEEPREAEATAGTEADRYRGGAAATPEVALASATGAGDFLPAGAEAYPLGGAGGDREATRKAVVETALSIRSRLS